MLFSKKALVAATTLLFASPVIEGKFLCCPNDDDVDNEYFDECEGCYTVPSKNAKEQSITGEASCLDALFVNYPGYPTRRLEELDLNFLPSALAKEARIVELDSGRQIIELSDGRHLVPFPDDLPKNHRALQGWDNPEWPPTYPMYPGKVVAYSLCEDTKNDLCCCDSSPYLYPVYKECEQACYFYEPDECQALELGTAVPAGPLNFSPDCLGTWRAEKCKPGLGLGGADPHFRTWAGNWYNFHGECDLVFLTTQRSGLGPLDIYIRTKLRYDYSFIENAVLRLGNSTLEISGWGQYLLDGISQAKMPAKLAGHRVTYEQINEKEFILLVHLPGKERIVMSTFKDWVTIKVENAGYNNFQGSVGLMGKYPHGALVGRDGSTIFEDHNAFGQEWQVLDTEPKLFQATNGPQNPQEKCIMPSLNAKAPPRVGQMIAKEAARKACAKSTFYEGHIDLCISDVMLSRDLDIAAAMV